MVKNTLFFVMKNYIFLCKGLNNYCTWLCHFESILSLLKNEKITKALGLRILHSLDLIQIISYIFIVY
jgi:hypothetical protein